jgi:hypothetical protein
MYGLTRATTTLIGAAAAGLLLWLSTQVAGESVGAYWASMGIIAGAGLVMAVSQLVGGWTKWGLPTVSPTVFLIGFLPVLVAGGLVLLAAQPDEGAFGMGWAGDIGLGWLADDLAAVLPAIAFAIGLTFGLTFDTTGVRREEEVFYDRDRVREHDRVAEEPVTAERSYVGTGGPHVVPVGPAHERDELVGAGTTRTMEPDVQTDTGSDARARARPRRRLFHRE